ncbi:MAG: hypothetical protein ABL993_02415 [Vicinamibacterales bacterium]
MIPTLDPCIVAQAAEAWKRANRDASSDEPDGTFFGESADQIIARAVGPHTRATARLYRAYEAEVHRLATGRCPLKLDPPRPPAKRRGGAPKLAPEELAEMRRRIRNEEPAKEIARALRRSLPLVYRVRKEMSA